MPLEQREIIWEKLGPNSFYLGEKNPQSICVVKRMVIPQKQECRDEAEQ